MFNTQKCDSYPWQGRLASEELEIIARSVQIFVLDNLPRVTAHGTTIEKNILNKKLHEEMFQQLWSLVWKSNKEKLSAIITRVEHQNLYKLDEN